MIERRFLTLIVITLLTGLAIPGEAWATKDPDRLFASNEILEITLTGPLRALARDRAKPPEVRPGQLTYQDDQGQTQSFEVSLEPRGNSRRDRDVCTFPPLWIHFDKKAVGGTLFAKQKKLKAVTYCRSPASFQDYVLKEYLVYRTFNELSDASFRVRLLKISFQEADSKSAKSKPLVRYGFFIEHKKRLAKRLDLKVVEPAERISPARLVPEQAAIGEMFQYMVSNTDFSFIAPPEGDNCCHNTVLFEPAGADAETTPYLPIPYDFDRTGVVSPPNGEPAAELGQRSFKDRVYRGFCRDPAYLEAAIAQTRSSREAIEALFSTQEGLSKKAKDSSLKYLANYYRVIDDPRRREKALKCRAVN